MLVIVGLIVGGVLVGRDLISAAAVRAQISQIEKYQQAVNTFRGKYGYLPGDIPEPEASRFGFAARGSLAGQGDGNGYLEGINSVSITSAHLFGAGETVMFWVDLSAARLIDGSFTAASSTVVTQNITATNIPNYFPVAAIGQGNHIYAFGGEAGGSNGIVTGLNYFGLSAISNTSASYIYSVPALSVRQASSIDSKLDDGLPNTGHVTISYLNRTLAVDARWAYGGGTIVGSILTPIAGSSLTCADNNNGASAPRYSLLVDNGNNLNCALSFKFQ